MEVGGLTVKSPLYFSYIPVFKPLTVQSWSTSSAAVVLSTSDVPVKPAFPRSNNRFKNLVALFDLFIWPSVIVKIIKRSGNNVSCYTVVVVLLSRSHVTQQDVVWTLYYQWGNLGSGRFNTINLVKFSQPSGRIKLTSLWITFDILTYLSQYWVTL